MKTAILAVTAVLCLAVSCRTIHFDTAADTGPAAKQEGVTSLEAEQAANEKEQEILLIEEELKEADIEKTVIYIDRPVYSPEREPESPPASGIEAAAESVRSSIQIPLKYANGMMFYPWDETFVYEIYCQPFRTTDIRLEPGEQVLEMPFLSEEKVWEVGAGVSRANGQDTQHFFLKPTYSNLTTSMIIITDRRVYHLLLKSYKDNYMVMVQWEYPPAMPFTVKAEAMNRRKQELDGLLVNPEYLSFDYKMTYSLFRKPVWLPRRVYDDGRKTYIELDEKMLHTEAPVIFNNRNERINYRVRKNLAIIDGLIEKITIRRGKEKVTVTKKRYAAPKYTETTDGQEQPPQTAGAGNAE